MSTVQNQRRRGQVQGGVGGKGGFITCIENARQEKRQTSNRKPTVEKMGKTRNM